MTSFKILDLTVLTQVLADFTEHYAAIRVTESSEEDIKICKDTIDTIKLEIASRRHLGEQPDYAC